MLRFGCASPTRSKTIRAPNLESSGAWSDRRGEPILNIANLTMTQTRSTGSQVFYQSAHMVVGFALWRWKTLLSPPSPRKGTAPSVQSTGGKQGLKKIIEKSGPYDAESRIPPRYGPRPSGSWKPGTGYWEIPAHRVYQDRDFRQGAHHQSLCKSQLSQQRR